MERFLVAFIIGAHEEDGNFGEMLREAEEEFPTWEDVKMFAADQRQAFDLFKQQRKPFAKDFGYEEIVEVAQNFVHYFSTYQNEECQRWKNMLVNMEHRGSGRVRLSRFYEGRDRPHWHFLESVDYLRAIGALDETTVGQPSVIIPNYVAGASNCLSPSEFYSVCCKDECEGLLAEVELAVGGPAATAVHLAEIVAKLESDTVDAPRNLSATQLLRLDEIAEHHSGMVPLHGRLFAQWMHHAYPRECPFPHLALTTTFATQHEWDGEAEATEEEMQKHVKAGWRAASAEASQGSASVETMPWLAVEELVASHKHMSASARSDSPMRIILFLVAAASALLPAGRAFKSFNLGSGAAKSEKHMV